MSECIKMSPHTFALHKLRAHTPYRCSPPRPAGRRMWPVVSFRHHLGGPVQCCCGGQWGCRSPVCGWPLPQTSLLICWKWTRLSYICSSSCAMQPEEVSHCDLRPDRKWCLVLNPLVQRGSCGMLPPVESLRIWTLMSCSVKKKNADELWGFFFTKDNNCTKMTIV